MLVKKTSYSQNSRLRRTNLTALSNDCRLSDIITSEINETVDILISLFSISELFLHIDFKYAHISDA